MSNPAMLGHTQRSKKRYRLVLAEEAAEVPAVSDFGTRLGVGATAKTDKTGTAQ